MPRDELSYIKRRKNAEEKQNPVQSKIPKDGNDQLKVTFYVDCRFAQKPQIKQNTRIGTKNMASRYTKDQEIIHNL